MITWPELTEGQWNLAAENVTSGTITRLKSEFTYWVTSKEYNISGVTPPENDVKNKSPKMFQESNQDTIDSDTAINVYIWIENSNAETIVSAENCIQVDL